MSQAPRLHRPILSKSNRAWMRPKKPNLAPDPCGAPQPPPANASAIDHLRAEIQYDEVELAGMKRFLPALEALYTTLSPAQRQAADAIFRQGPGG